MKYILLFLIMIFGVSFFYLSKEYGSTSVNYVFGKFIYKFFPQSLKKIVLTGDEKQLLKEMNSSYSYKKAHEDYSSEKIGSIFLVFYLSVLFTLIFGNYYMESQEIKGLIEKPMYEDGIDKSKKERLKYKIERDGGTTEGFVDLLIEESMSEDDIVNFLESKYEELLPIILAENKGRNEIKTDLNFVRNPFDRGIEVKYESSNRDLINNSGKLLIKNIDLGKKYPLSVKVIMTYREVSLPFIIDFIVERDALSISEEERLLNKRIVEDEGKIILPDSLKESESKIRWYKLGKGIVWYKLLAGSLLIMIAFYYLYKLVLEARCEERKRLIALDIPDLINKLVLLVKAGFTPERAWCIVCDDYENTSVVKRPLFEEMLISKKELLKGISFDEVLLNFGRRISNRELMAMVSLLIQNNKRGSSLLITALEQMGKESWELRLKNAKTMGEKASTRLLIPLGISFLVLILIVLAPVMMSINI